MQALKTSFAWGPKQAIFHEHIFDFFVNWSGLF